MLNRTVLCVSNLDPDNRVSLQDTDTRDYFRGVHRWTPELKDALSFVDMAEAHHICRYLGIEMENGATQFRTITLNASPIKIPLTAKLTVTAFLAVLIPVYLHSYGPTNFLWFCDAALILTVAGMWMESSLIISMCAVGILIPQCLWLADFGSHLLGFRLFGLTTYMFDSNLPLFTRGLSLFHGWLPLLLLWLLGRLGYDKRALIAWTALAASLVMICYWFMPPAGAHLADSNIPINLNYIYGFNDQHPQTWLNQNLYVMGWLGVLWMVAYFPTHLALRKIFQAHKPTFDYKPSIRFV